jgi:phosphate transport system permease protein
MTVISTPANGRVDLTAKRSWRSTKSNLFSGLMGAAFVLVLIPLGLVVFTVVSKGIGIINVEFFTSEIPIRSREIGPGMGPAVLGTLIITATATIIAVPLGILGAIYLNEYGGNTRISKLVRFMATVMTGVPSIVMGLLIYVTFTLRFKQSGLGGALALAALMLPIVIRSTEEMLKLVPNAQREAALALGTSKSRTILTVVIPAALAGIVSGSLLAVARAAGETAPLLFTIGAATKFNPNVFSGANTALSTQIFSNANSTFVGAIERAWGAALTLVTLTFLFTLAARLVTARFSRKQK